jgi:PadR family transcriptional regulator PadR
VSVIVLGEFEYLMLTAAARLGEDAYGAAIRQEIDAGNRLPLLYWSALYDARSFGDQGPAQDVDGRTPQRGGRPKRLVRVTAKGIRAASDFYAVVMKVTRGVSLEANRIVIEI